MKGGPQTWDELNEELVGVDRACISLDGTRIAAVFADKTLCIYDTTTGETIYPNHPPFIVDEIPWKMIFSRDGNLIALGGQALRLWNVQTGEEVGRFDIKVFSLAFSPDGSCIAAGCAGRYSIGDDSPNGSCIAAGCAGRYNIEDDGDGSYNLRIINLELAKMSGHVIQSGGEGRTLLKGEVPPSPFEGHVSDVFSVAYSPDGKQIASGSNDFTVRVWDVSTGSRNTFTTDIYRINHLVFSPDGTQIAADIGLFNLSTGSFTPHAFDTRNLLLIADSFSFSADGRLLASGFDDETCCIWDASIHENILQLVGHLNYVRSVAFFPDGNQIMSASWDGTIRVWDVELRGEREEMDGWRMNYADNGYWIVSPEGEPLFWTPLPLRHTRNTLVIGKCLTIDFSNFIHGDDWVKCREPL